MSNIKLKPGDPAPDFEAIDDNGRPFRLSELRGQKVILYFYPKDLTSGCTTQACGFRDHYPAVTEKNATVIGVSPDSVESHQKFKSQHNLPFRLLVDVDHQIAERYGTWAEKKRFGRTSMGIIRSHFVIDEQGTIVDARYSVSPEQSVETAVAALG